MIAAIVAIDRSYGIGYENKLLCSIPEDLKRFKELTLNKVVIMGTNTWRSLPTRPLPQRYNMIVTRNPFAYSVSNNEYDFYSWEDVKKYLEVTNDDVFIIGGALVYKELLPYCDTIYLTYIDKDFEHVDTYFPKISSDTWQMTDMSQIKQYLGTKYQFRTYNRII